ncbi:MAG: class I SAM-dependent methyltransferase [Bacillota bacterium]
MEIKTNYSALNQQQIHWENTFAAWENMLGDSPSYAAEQALNFFKDKGITNILELGAGQGRDTVFFAKNGMKVYALDYTDSGVKSIHDKAVALGLSDNITVKIHDVRKPFPFLPQTFEGCFSHMLYCMAFTTNELKFISKQICQVLKRDGYNIFTTRNNFDAHYGNGIHLGEDLYENYGFIVHFLSKEKIEQISNGFEITNINEFEEGELPRKIYIVTSRKK